MQLKEISLEDVFPSESNPRQDFGDIEAFADSFENGQPNIPIIVAQEGGIYSIVDGERRYRAMKVLGTKRTNALVCESQSDADTMVAMVAADNKKQLTPVELSRGIQQALHFADVERVEKVSGRKSLGRVKRARAKVQDAADDMSLDRLLAIDELSFSRAAVDQLTNCREAEWRRVYDRIKQDLETERRTQELDDELEAAGIAKAMRMPDGDWGYFAQCGQGDVQKLVERADGAELVAVGTGLYRSVYRRTDEQVSRAEDERRKRIDELDRAIADSAQRRAEWLGALVNAIDDDPVRFANSKVVAVCTEAFRERFAADLEGFDEVHGTCSARCVNEVVVALGMPKPIEARHLVDGCAPMYIGNRAQMRKRLFAAFLEDGYEPRDEEEAELFGLMEKLEVE